MHSISSAAPTALPDELAAPEPPENPVALAHRRRRNRALLLAVAMQAIAIPAPLLAVLSLPLGLVCVLYAACAHLCFHDTTSRPSAAFVRVASVLFTLVGGSAASVAASVGAWTVAMALGNGFSRGRQIRVKGKINLPELEAHSRWSDHNAVPMIDVSAIPAQLRPALAARWRHNGKTEHASVAAFAKLSLELLELGAPPELIEASSRDGADEIRHARLCFALARSLDDRREGPRAFPAARASLNEPRVASAWVHLAVDSLYDGVLQEGFSARVLATLAGRCQVPSIARLLRGLAADEGRHAAHAWDVVEWCVARGGDEVLIALHSALARVPRENPTDLPEAARDGSWEAWGIHGAALEAESWRSTLRFVEARIAALSPAEAA